MICSAFSCVSIVFHKASPPPINRSELQTFPPIDGAAVEHRGLDPLASAKALPGIFFSLGSIQAVCLMLAQLSQRLTTTHVSFQF